MTYFPPKAGEPKFLKTMRISADEQKMKRQAKIGRAALTGSLVVLIGGLLLTLIGPQYGLLTPQNTTLFLVVYMAILAVGFTVSRVGMYYGNRYLSPTRPELMLREKLKGLDRKYVLMLFQKPTDYYLVEPGGVTAIITRATGVRRNSQSASTITYKAGKWNTRTSFFSSWFGQEEPFGDPMADAATAAKAINDQIAAYDANLKVPVRAVVLFTNTNLTLNIEPSPTAVLKIDDLKDFVRSTSKLKELPSSIQRKMREALGAPELQKME